MTSPAARSVSAHSPKSQSPAVPPAPIPSIPLQLRLQARTRRMTTSTGSWGLRKPELPADRGSRPLTSHGGIWSFPSHALCRLPALGADSRTGPQATAYSTAEMQRGRAGREHLSKVHSQSLAETTRQHPGDGGWKYRSAMNSTEMRFLWKSFQREIASS